MKAAFVGRVGEFVLLVEQNRIQSLVEDEYIRQYGTPGAGERRSWANSYRPLADLLSASNIDDSIIALEVQIPQIGGFRFDVVICGQGNRRIDTALIIELKAWDRVEESIYGHPKVKVPGYLDSVNHPCYQSSQYKLLVEDWIDEANPDIDGSIAIKSISYLFNLNKNHGQVLYDDQYKLERGNSPLYCGDDYNQLTKYLHQLFSDGGGSEVWERFSNSEIKPSKHLLDNLEDILINHERFILVGEQLEALEQIKCSLQHFLQTDEKQVIVIDGGPGSGKTAVAMNLMSFALQKGIIPDFVAVPAAVTKGLRKVLPRLSKRFRYSFGYVPYDESRTDYWNRQTKTKNEVDLLIVDEAHRLPQRTLTNGFSSYPVEFQSKISTTRELIRASKVTVFFSDDKQIIKPSENVTQEDIIRDALEEGAVVHRFSLPYQFRAGGSSRYLSWLDGILQNDDVEPFKLALRDQIRFEIVDDPNEFLQEIQESNHSRIIAGWCWFWRQKFSSQGGLVDEVVINNHNGVDFAMPWEAPLSKNGTRDGIPAGEFWAVDPRAKNQIGSVYTVQGYDFPTICVIWPLDLQWNPQESKWTTYPGRTVHKATEKNGPAMYDNVDRELRNELGDSLIRYLKNIYRILLTRGLYSVKVYFMHEPTKKRFEDYLDY